MSALFAVPVHAQAADGSGSARVDALIARMSLDEKISLLHGAQESAQTDQGEPGYWPGLPQYGIPPLRFTDGPPGVFTRRNASAPPATMALAATFSPADSLANGQVIARSAKALGQQVLLEPYINIHRDQTFGRAFNTYGEDPLLTAEMGAAMIRGIQGEGVMAQAKHYIAYEAGDPVAGGDIWIGEQALHEIYLVPFAAAVDANVSSFMCAYNRINGPYACGSRRMQVDILRGELHFKGFITSDWGAVHTSEYVSKGTDLEMPGTGLLPTFMAARPPPPIPLPSGPFPPAGVPEENSGADAPGAGHKLVPSAGLLDAITAGTVSVQDVDRAVGHILYEVEQFGWLDHPPSLEQSPDPAQAAAPILRKTAADGAVLLKNSLGTLPLTTDDLKRVALIGPGAGQLIAVASAGEKAIGHIERQVSPLAALKQIAGAGAHIAFAVDNDMDGHVIPFSVLRLKREGGGDEGSLDLTQRANAPLPPGTSATWKGSLTIPASGRYRLHLQVLGATARLYIDGKLAAGTRLLTPHSNVTRPIQDNLLPTTDGLDNIRIESELSAGPHRIELEEKADDSGDPVQLRLAWVTPAERAADHAAAIDAARQAGKAVVFVWARNKPFFQLPGDQDRLIEEVAAVNPNTIVVLNTSEPFAMPWLNKVKAVLQMWYPGDEGGQATAELLVGTENPAGRLPFTWPVHLSDNVANDPIHPERSSAGFNGKISYSEGILVGYRWFDSRKIMPLYPFGFGLSYSRFGYSGLSAHKHSNGAVRVRFTIKNESTRAGDEVAQIYLGPPSNPSPGGPFAPQSLIGFERVHLRPGEIKTLNIELPARRFEYWSEQAMGWSHPKGRRPLWVGGSSRDHRLSATLPE